MYHGIIPSYVVVKKEPSLITTAFLGLLLLSSAMAAETTRYGFVGVGTMSSAIVRGMCTLPGDPACIVLSPRGAVKAAALAAEFPDKVTIASGNQEVVDKSDVVFIGVLPKQTEVGRRAAPVPQCLMNATCTSPVLAAGSSSRTEVRNAPHGRLARLNSTTLPASRGLCPGAHRLCGACDPAPAGGQAQGRLRHDSKAPGNHSPV